MSNITYKKIKTDAGSVLIKEVYRLGNIDIGEDPFEKVESKFFDAIIDEPIEVKDNYLKYTNLNKCLTYANVYVEDDENIEFVPYYEEWLTQRDFQEYCSKARENGRDLIDNEYQVIKKGVPEKIAIEQLSKIVRERFREIRASKREKIRQKQEELRRLEEEKAKYKWYDTFMKVYGDLFKVDNNNFKYYR